MPAIQCSACQRSFCTLQGVFTDPEAALQEYGARRTTDGKGVTIPSQRRYLHYFHAQIVSLGLLRAPWPTLLRLQHLSLLGLPSDSQDRLSLVVWTRVDEPPLKPDPLAILVAQESRLRINSRFAGGVPPHSCPSLYACLLHTLHGSGQCMHRIF